MGKQLAGALREVGFTPARPKNDAGPTTQPRRRGVRCWFMWLALAGACLVGLPAGAQAYNCHNWGCVNRALNKMQKQVTTDTRVLRSLVGCLGEAPIDQFGNPTGSSGYAFSNDGIHQVYTTALDLVPAGKPVGAWFLTDACNRAKASVRSGGRLPLTRGSIASEAVLVPRLAKP